MRVFIFWQRARDSNLQQPGPKPSVLPAYTTSRSVSTTLVFGSAEISAYYLFDAKFF